MKPRLSSPKLTAAAPSLFVVLAMAAITPTAFATDATWTGASGGTQDWQTATNWSTNPTIPNGAGDTATFANTLTSNTTVLLNGAVTLGSLVNQDTNNEINIQNGTGGSLTFDTGTAAVPTIDVSARTNGVGILLYATVNGSNGLSVTGSTTTQIRVNGSTNWSGFSGGLTVTQGILAPQAGNYNYNTNVVTANTVLPTDERLTLGTVGTTGFNLSSGRDLAVGSLAGTSNAGVYNTSTGGSFAVLAVGNDNTTDAVFAGTVGAAASGANANMLHLHKIGSGTQEISGKVTGTGNVSVLNGTLVLSNSSNNNDYTGTTTVSNSTLKIGSANALGSTASGTTLNGNGTLDLNGVTTGESITFSNGGNKLVNSSASAAGISADATLNADITVDATGDITASRLIGSSIRTVTKLGNGTLTTNGSSHNNLTAWDIQAGKVVFANTSGYGADRGVTLNGGILQLSGSNSDLVNNGQSFTINSGSFDLNGKAEAVAAIGGNGGTVTNSAASTASTVYVGGGPSGSSSATYGGVIEDGAGVMNVTKEGSGTQTLNGANTYTGATTISGGTIALGASGSIDNTSGVSLGTSGTFDVSAKTGGYTVNNLTGSGTVVGALTVSTELAIGNSPGTVNFDDLTLASSATYTHELVGGGTEADLGNISGSLTIDGAILDLVQLGTYTLGDKFTLFAYETGSLTGTFDGLADGAEFTDADGLWRINYFDTEPGLNGGTGTSFVTVEAIPEPAAALLGSLGLLALLRRRRN